MSKTETEPDPIFEEAEEIIEALEYALYVALEDGCGDYELPQQIIFLIERFMQRLGGDPAGKAKP